MSFQEKFKGKISVVGRRGLKYTLFRPKNPQLPPQTHREVLSNYRKCQSPPPSPQNFHPLKRQSTHQELLLQNEQKQLLSTHASSRQSHSLQNPRFGLKHKNSFLDDMLQKHKNLLSVIDRRSSYKA